MSSGESHPNIVILAGPNGAGKPTVAPFLLRDALGIDEFVNADTIAAGLCAYAPETVAFEAGRIMLTRMRELAESRASFALETTLATRSYASHRGCESCGKQAIASIWSSSTCPARRPRSIVLPIGCAGAGITSTMTWCAADSSPALATFSTSTFP